MRIAVVGATGQLGSELLSLWGDRAVGLSREQLDLTRPESLDEALESSRADLVVNAAAYNHVDRAETESSAALEVNAQGPRQLARTCASRGLKLVHVSTDFVFGADTIRQTPYVETDPTGPLGAYGVSKLGGELFVRSGCMDHLVVRTSGLYGHAARWRDGGGNFVETMLQLADSQRPIRVVDDQRCTPTSTAVLATAIDRLVQADCVGLYHATCTGSTTWYDFARAVFGLAGREVVVEPITTSEFGAAAARPGYSVLDCSRLTDQTGYEPPDWNTALAAYLLTRDEGRDTDQGGE